MSRVTVVLAACVLALFFAGMSGVSSAAPPQHRAAVAPSLRALPQAQVIAGQSALGLDWSGTFHCQNNSGLIDCKAYGYYWKFCGGPYTPTVRTRNTGEVDIGQASLGPVVHLATYHNRSRFRTRETAVHVWTSYVWVVYLAEKRWAKPTMFCHL
jgi:hypothetical protein